LEQLVTGLTRINSPAPGLTPMANFEAFIAEDRPPTFAGGVLGVPPPAVPGAMREIVRRGISALPTLIAHLGDEPPTGLIVGKRLGRPGGFFTWGYFGDDYDPRNRPAQRPRPDYEKQRERMNNFPSEYTVRVGDVCYALIGQIVDRRLIAVRYQPTAGIVVNSPIEEPSLAERVRRDWSTLTPEERRDSLLADIEAARYPHEYFPALARLHFYYPDADEKLTGTALERRLEYEHGGNRQ
jgi:hypothetical protein